MELVLISVVILKIIMGTHRIRILCFHNEIHLTGGKSAWTLHDIKLRCDHSFVQNDLPRCCFNDVILFVTLNCFEECCSQALAKPPLSCIVTNYIEMTEYWQTLVRNIWPNFESKPVSYIPSENCLMVVADILGGVFLFCVTYWTESKKKRVHGCDQIANLHPWDDTMNVCPLAL